MRFAAFDPCKKSDDILASASIEELKLILEALTEYIKTHPRSIKAKKLLKDLDQAPIY